MTLLSCRSTTRSGFERHEGLDGMEEHCALSLRALGGGGTNGQTTEAATLVCVQLSVLDSQAMLWLCKLPAGLQHAAYGVSCVLLTLPCVKQPAT